MRGHITKRADDSYTIVVNLGVDPATGKRKQQWVSVKGTKKDAERKLAELLHQVDTGIFLKPSKTSLADFLRRWLEEYVHSNLGPRTAEGYESIIVQHLIPKLGNIALTQLKPEHIQKYYANTLASGRCNGRGGLTPLTVRHHHMALHKALEAAVKWGLILRNPADSIDPPRFERSEIRFMNESELQAFLEGAKATPHYALFYTALFTGMRRSELLGLRWSDVDFILCQLSVARSLHRLRNGDIVFRPPKTARGRRIISLSPSTVLVLKQHRDAQEVIRRALGGHLGEEDLVFSRPDGTPLQPNVVTLAWVRLAKRVGLRGIRFHDARHTHASLMLKQGIHPKIVQERLGHSTIAITLDTYSHVAPGLQQAAAKRFDEVLMRDSLEKSSSNGRLAIR